MDTLHPSISRDIANGNFEESNGGIYLPKHKVLVGGVFSIDHMRDGQLLETITCPNIIVNEGLDHILSAVYNGGTQITAWYVGLFEGNYTPVAGDTGANIVANSTECVAYDESTREAWVEAAPSGQSITNSASKATFTINATKTVYGAFLISTNVKSDTAGSLMAASRFAASRSVVATDQLLVTYTLSAADA